ncbi:hypothetical protein [Herbaspirillum autotrophicum]|uniref:hypothetical protein n=1 Tax=Herbaspirillum autotrophicum TaxID=180195 RepID=UPI0012ED9FF0|nr:hypothetical protein [Herbaspirillum autotrophicum]
MREQIAHLPQGAHPWEGKIMTTATTAWKTISAGFALLSIATATMASPVGGIAYFSGKIVEPPCSATLNQIATPANQVSINCTRPSAFAVSFQSVARSVAGSAASLATQETSKPVRYSTGIREQRSVNIPSTSSNARSSLLLTTITITYQ